MAVVYDLFTKQVITSIPGTSNPNYYAAIKERLEARFGGNLPYHFKRAMNKPQTQPYKYGDCHNVKYRPKVRNFNSPMPVPCEVTQESCHKDEYGNLVLGLMCHQGTDEPFPWMDAKYKVSLSFLRSLPDGCKLIINTRSDLIAHEDYVHELKRLKVEVNILYVTDDDVWNRLNELGAPSFERRKLAINTLRANDIVCGMIKLLINIKEQVS